MATGSAPTLHISKAVIRQDGKYLLLLRARHSAYYPSTWDFPGGKDDPGETPAQSVIRETMEETSLTIDPGKEVKMETYHDTAHTLIFHYYHPTVVSGTVALSEDHEQFNWFMEREIQALHLHPSVPIFFRKSSA